VSTALRREEARREVLRFLAERNLLAHSPAAIRNGVNRAGFDFSEEETLSALQSLVSGQFAREVRGALGASTTYQATLEGELLIERGEA
jgi:hypothetical protein